MLLALFSGRWKARSWITSEEASRRAECLKRSKWREKTAGQCEGQLEVCEKGQMVVLICPVRGFLQERPGKGRLLGLTAAVALSDGSDERRKKGQEILILVNSD